MTYRHSIIVPQHTRNGLGLHRAHDAIFAFIAKDKPLSLVLSPNFEEFREGKKRIVREITWTGDNKLPMHWLKELAALIPEETKLVVRSDPDGFIFNNDAPDIERR